MSSPSHFPIGDPHGGDLIIYDPAGELDDGPEFGGPVDAAELAYYEQRDRESRADFWVGRMIKYVDPSWPSRPPEFGTVRDAYAYADGENGPSAADEHAPVATLNVTFADGSRRNVDVDCCERI